VHIVENPQKAHIAFINGISAPGCAAGLWVGQIIALPAEIQRWLIYLYSAYVSDNKLIIYWFKRGFFWVCIEKGARSFAGEKYKKQAN